MLLSFLTQQNHQHTQSQILSWNTDAFPANFSQIKHKQLIKIITLFSMRTFFTIKPLHFQNQMTALLMNKSMSQKGPWGNTITFYRKPNSRRKRFWKICKSRYKVSSDKYRWSAEYVIFQRNVADRSVGVNKATFPTKSGIRSYGNKILNRRQVCFVDWSQESRG